MPNRIIKEGIRTSETVNAMTDFQFRLWVSLITFVDDFGRGDARPAVIKGACFPLREKATVKEIEKAMKALASIGSIVLYQVDGHPFLCFPHWEKHQTIRNRKSKFPAPSEEDLKSNESNCIQLQAKVPVIQSNPIQSVSINKNKKKYGEYGNVLLTDEEVEKLKTRYDDWERRIETLSEYMASKGKRYSDHYATINAWARKDTPKKTETHVSGTDEIRKLMEVM